MTEMFLDLRPFELFGRRRHRMVERRADQVRPEGDLGGVGQAAGGRAGILHLVLRK